MSLSVVGLDAELVGLDGCVWLGGHQCTLMSHCLLAVAVLTGVDQMQRSHRCWWLLVQSPRNMPLYLRDRSSQALACATTLR